MNNFCIGLKKVHSYETERNQILYTIKENSATKQKSRVICIDKN